MVFEKPVSVPDKMRTILCCIDDFIIMLLRIQPVARIRFSTNPFAFRSSRNSQRSTQDFDHPVKCILWNPFNVRRFGGSWTILGNSESFNHIIVGPRPAWRTPIAIITVCVLDGPNFSLFLSIFLSHSLSLSLSLFQKGKKN